MNKMKVYLDHSATTPVDPAVLAQMLPYFTANFGNANSLHSDGRVAAKAVLAAREQAANAIGARPSEIYFTSGGTEGDNWALKGIAARYRKKGNRIVLSRIEHPAMISAAKQLAQDGFEVMFAEVGDDGIIKLDDLREKVNGQTILVSCMLCNNEIGTVQPLADIARIAHEAGALVHTDAVQAVGNIAVNVGTLGVDLLTYSAHKFYGPKGVGVLYKKTGVSIEPLLIGGHQERTVRGGTTNVPGVVGLGAAVELATRDLEKNAVVMRACRDRFVDAVLRNVPDTRLNGSMAHRVPGNAHLSFQYVEAESVLQLLDLRGIAVSTGSACSSGSLESSHVLLAIGCSVSQANGSLRFSFGKENTLEEADYAATQLREVIQRLREMSPLCS